MVLWSNTALIRLFEESMKSRQSVAFYNYNQSPKLRPSFLTAMLLIIIQGRLKLRPVIQLLFRKAYSKQF